MNKIALIFGIFSFALIGNVPAIAQASSEFKGLCAVETYRDPGGIPDQISPLAEYADRTQSWRQAFSLYHQNFIKNGHIDAARVQLAEMSANYEAKISAASISIYTYEGIRADFPSNGEKLLSFLLSEDDSQKEQKDSWLQGSNSLGESARARIDTDQSVWPTQIVFPGTSLKCIFMES